MNTFSLLHTFTTYSHALLYVFVSYKHIHTNKHEDILVYVCRNCKTFTWQPALIACKLSQVLLVRQQQLEKTYLKRTQYTTTYFCMNVYMFVWVVTYKLFFFWLLLLLFLRYYYLFVITFLIYCWMLLDATATLFLMLPAYVTH